MPSWQDAPVIGAAPTAPAWAAAPIAGDQPDTASANRAFAQATARAAAPSLADQAKQGASAAWEDFIAPIEAATNAGTGLVFGFPAYLGAALGGLAQKHLLGMDVDPKELAETISGLATYHPQTQKGQQLASQLMWPLQKLSEGAEAAGHKVSDVMGSAGAGAITDATLQVLPMILMGELGRKMGGQTVTAEDMQNVAKVVAGEGAPPEAVAATEASLRATYEKTGIGPFTVAEEAARSPEIRAQLADPAVEVPQALRQYVETPGEPQAPRPGDGAPLMPESPTEEKVAAQTENIEQPSSPASPSTRARLVDIAERLGLSTSEAGTGFHSSDGSIVIPPEDMEVAGAGSPDDVMAHEVGHAIMQTRGMDFEGFPASEMRKWIPNWPQWVEASKAFRPDVHGHESATLRRYAMKPNEIIADAIGSVLTGKSPESLVVGKVAGLTRADLGLAGPDAMQPSSATYREGAGTLNAGLNPAAAVAAYRDSYTPFVGVEQDHLTRPPAIAEGGRSPLGDSILKIFAPAARGELAQRQAGIMRANFGEMAREREVALSNLKDYAAQFDKMPVAESVKFTDAIERGVKIEDPALAAAAKDLRALLDAKRDDVQALGKGQLEHFDEDYFPHMWKNPDAAGALFARRPLTGSGSFLKARTIPLTTDGLRWRAYDAEGDFVKSFDTEAEAKEAAGTEGRVGAPLQPITSNPVEMALLKAREMDRYVYGQRIFQEMKTADLARFVGFGDHAPPGWTKINDKIARVLQPNEGEGGGMILRGEYYAPDEAATLINNHLSPGLQGNSFFDTWRKAANMMNTVQLGLSFFHVGFTTLDAMTSRIALGIQQVARGDVVKGAGNVAMGVTPAQPFINWYRGDRLLKAYLGKLDNPDLLPIVDAIMQAGGRVKMDDFYRNESVNAFKQALRNEDYGTAALKAIPTLLDRIGAPIFEWLVPRQKLGVFFDMAKDWITENPKASLETKRAELGRLWDSVDNRMGQLVYDNVFWNRTLKDGLMASVRSVGWNLGTFRELGGGVADAVGTVKDAATGKGYDGISTRTAYVAALPILAGIYGAVTQFIYTGEGPRDLKDLFYPRTGRLRPDGSEDRVSLPTYMKDVFAYGEDAHNQAAYGTGALNTITNKANPLISTLAQMYSNKDYFDGAIRNPADPAVRQMQDLALYMAKQLEPFSMRNYLQQAKEKGEEPTFAGYMTSPSMVGITPAPGYMVHSPEQNESAHVSQLHDALIQKYREEIKAGGDVEALIPHMLAGGLSKADIRRVIATSGDVPKPHKLKHFGEAPP